MGKKNSRSRIAKVDQLRAQLESLRKSLDGSRKADREFCDACRAVLRLHEDWVTADTAQEPGEVTDALRELAREAMLYLGGEADLWSTSLKDYDHGRYGPYLGVSDEGSAVDVIRDAAIASPKAMALDRPTPMKLGVAHDAERLGAIGEVPVGPEEYADIRLGCTGRILTSTNVGTRLNLRFYKRNPVVVVPKGSSNSALKEVRKKLRKIFRPFLNTPDGNPRSLTAFVVFHRESRRSFQDRAAILRELAAYVRDPDNADADHHRIGLQMRIGFGTKGRNAALLAINLASAAGLSEVAIDGVVSKEADALLSLPGLLNYLAPAELQAVLDRAKSKGVNVRPVNAVDPDTVARALWTSLLAARSHGVALGKYGTFPLTLEETDRVVGLVQSWFPDWSAAPVFFVDQGILTSEKVYSGATVVEGLKKWLKVVACHGVPVVLIDTVDKSQGWCILKDKSTGTKGLLTKRQIQTIDRFAAGLGVKVLWAGSISLRQAYELGKMRVFGIYVTSAVADAMPVSSDYEADPLLPSMKEPTRTAVSRVNLLLEAGFLTETIKGNKKSKDMTTLATSILDIVQSSGDPNSDRIRDLEEGLVTKTMAAWKHYLSHP